MNDFSEQLGRSARRLRERRNAGLRVPPCPRPKRRSRTLALCGAAACAGLAVGLFIPDSVFDGMPTDVLARVDTLVVERIVRDTVVLDAPVIRRPKTVALTENPNAPTGNSVALTGHPIAPTGAGDTVGVPARPVRPSVPAPDERALISPDNYALYAATSGRNVLDDSIDYSLFVSR